jgi:hypothetical protein
MHMSPLLETPEVELIRSTQKEDPSRDKMLERDDHAGDNTQMSTAAVAVTPEATGEEDNGSRNEEIIEERRCKQWSLLAIREAAGKLVNHAHFQVFIIILILINAIMMGIGTFDFVQNNPSTSEAFEATDKAFLIAFTIELAMQFIYRDFGLFTDGWLVFDFVIVVMSWSLESLQIVRTFRVFRALRLVTRIKVLKNLITSLFSVAPRMLAIFCLLLLIFYIYGVMCTVLFKDLFREGLTTNDYFSRLDISLWTLLAMMTLDWGDTTRQVMLVYPWAWAIFVSFVMITSFIAYNLIIAVVCDSVSVIEKMDKEEVEDEDDQEAKEAVQYRKIRQLQERVAELAKQQQQVLQALLETFGNDLDLEYPSFCDQTIGKGDL